MDSAGLEVVKTSREKMNSRLNKNGYFKKGLVSPYALSFLGTLVNKTAGTFY